MPNQRLYIGNLPYVATENEVRELFSPYEPIHSVTLVSDWETGRPTGFGFIELEEPKAETAMCEMENKVFGGRSLRIGKASDKPPREDDNPPKEGEKEKWKTGAKGKGKEKGPGRYEPHSAPPPSPFPVFGQKLSKRFCQFCGQLLD